MYIGTGHELNFLCYLYKQSILPQDPLPINRILSVLREYFKTVISYLSNYIIEPAGARGCRSIDDYLFLAFLFVSSENFHNDLSVEFLSGGLFKKARDMGKMQKVLENMCRLNWKSINIGLLKM